MPISDLVAAQLAFAAYTPREDFLTGFTSINGVSTALSTGQYRDDTYPTNQSLASLPAGWSVDLQLTFPDGAPTQTPLAEQFIVFRNQSAGQIVFAFKGTNSWQEAWSDIADTGATSWNRVKDEALRALNIAKNDYTTFEIMADGHSLGGGMAQTFALKNDLNGYGQNSLPIARDTILDDFRGDVNFASTVSSWTNSGKTFAEVNTYGDPATMYYSFLNNNAYLDKTPQALVNIYGPLEVLAAAAASTNPVAGLIGFAALGYVAHIPQTIISALQGNPVSVPQATITGPQANLIGSMETDVSSIVLQGGSLVVTQTDGKVYTVTPSTTGSSLAALSARPSGQSYIYDVGSGRSYTVTSSSPTGSEAAVVLDSLSGTQMAFDLNSSLGAGKVELPGGGYVSITGAGTARLTSFTGAEQGLVNFLSPLGGPSTVAQLNQLLLDQLHPAMGAFNYHPIIGALRSDGKVSIDNLFQVNANKTGSGNLTGQSTAVVYNPATGTYVTAQAYNILDVSGSQSLVDFSQYTLTNFQEFRLRGGDAAMTAAQFNSFGAFGGVAYGYLHILSGGTASMLGKFTVTPSWEGFLTLQADSQAGTTLIAADGVNLRASLFGNDTLQAGNLGSLITAGYGVNSIIGGTGADTINLLAGKLAAGSSINGGAGSDKLSSYADASESIDISGGTVSGVETLAMNTATTKLNTAQLAGFSSVSTSNAAGLMLVGSNAGVYSLSGKALTGTVNLTGSDGDDVLTGGSTTQKLFGGAGNDRISYMSAATRIDGGIGNDTLVFVGSAPAAINLASATIGSTTVSGIESVDTSGATGALTITGDANANSIRGGTSADTLLGGDGDDTIVYDAADVLEDGGAGSDTLILNQTVATVADLSLTSDQVAGGGTTINFENIDASASTAALTLAGDGNANVIKGGVGADAISGGAGDDTISYDALDTSTDGGAGNDTLIISSSVALSANLSPSGDQVSGGGTTTNFENIDGSTSTAALTILGDAGNNIISSGTGNDSLTGGAGNDTLSAGAGNDFIVGGTGVDAMYGGDGNDTLTVLAGEDAVGEVIDGGTGTNVLELGNVDVSQSTITNIQTFRLIGAGAVAGVTAAQIAGASSIIAAGGNATLLAKTAGTYDLSTKTLSGTINLTGSTGNDTLVGGTGAQTILADAGDDTVTYDAADLAIDGGAGDDTLILPYGVAFNLANSANQVTGSTIVTGFEHVVVLPPPNLTLTGDAGNNTLTGGAGNDTIDGLGGNDTLDGAAGSDTLRGGDGSDTIFLDAADAITDGGSGVDILFLRNSPVATINLAAVNQMVGGTNIVTGFEYLHAVEMTNAMVATGDGNNNILNMGSGNDSIDGAGGIDTLYGNGGDDWITYDGADAVADGGAGIDTLVVNRTTALTIDLRNTDAVAGDAGSTTGFENVAGATSTGALTIIGSVANNTLRGGTGSDVIADPGGDDVIDGDLGADYLYGNGGNDTITYDAADYVTDGAAGNDTLVVNQIAATTINLSTTSDQVTGGGTTTGFENVDGTSSTAALTIFGDANANIIKGGAGADIFYASAGGDQRYGGAGGDVFFYAASDTVTDGGTGTDWLAVQQGVATINLANVADQSSGDTAIVTGIEYIDGLGNTSALNFTGDGAANFVRGGVAADTLFGGAGDDIMYYDASDVSTDGGAGNDTLVINDLDSRAYKADVAVTVNLANTDQVSGGGVTTGFEHVNGSQSTVALTITGNTASNTLRGGDNNDVLDGGAGADSLYGGAGSDTIFYDAADAITDAGTGVDILFLRNSAVATINLAAANQVVGGTNVVTGFEYLHAVEMTNAMVATGNGNNNILNMGSGNDSIDGAGGIDTLYGNGGDDRIVYDVADTIADGGAGSDTLVLNQTVATSVNLVSTTDQVTGGGTTIGFENVDGTGSTGALTISGSLVNSILRGGAGADVIADAGGDDVIDGGAGADYLYGNGGNDTITYDATDNVTDGAAGNDTLVMNQAVATTINLSTTSDQVTGGGTTTGFENVDGTGSSGILTVFGDATANIIKGGSGNDLLYASAGGDQRYGGAGGDVLFYSASDAITDGGTGIDWLAIQQGVATINLANVADQSSGDTAIVTGIEYVDGLGNASALNITGDGAANFIRGGVAADTLSGGAGDDIMYYDASDVSTDGGSGNDTLVINDLDSRAYKADVAATVNLANTDQIAGGGATSGFEHVNGSQSTVALTIIGDAGMNTLRGGASSDVINGDAGADNLYGGAGNDTITYDAADLVEDGGTGIDWLILNQSTATTVNLANSGDQISGDAGVTTGFDKIDGSGSTADLTLIGDGTANTLKGGSGNDRITYDAADILHEGGSGSDWLVINQAAPLTVDLRFNDQVSADGALTQGFENVDANACTGNLSVTGDNGNNHLTTGYGNDTLAGGLGDDVLVGGGGSDSYQFSRGDGTDTVYDYDAIGTNVDTLSFLVGIAHDQLWFSQAGNDLNLSVIGTTDKVTIGGWFESSARQMEAIRAGGQELYNTNVINLVNAMAGMTPPPAGQTTLSTAQHTQLDPVIAANWHAAA